MNLSKNIDDKIKNRLLKYYLCWFEQRDSGTAACTNYLFENRNNLPYHQKLLNSIGVSQHDQIANFLKDCLKNGFSDLAISKFIEMHKDIFFDAQCNVYTININNKYKFTIEDSARDKNTMVFRFLLLILDISQDENFCNPKQKLTIDYILKLAKNITDYKVRYVFKIAAMGCFLPDDKEYIKLNLSSVISDIKKLFAEELSDNNNEIVMEHKFNIKLGILNMLTAKTKLIRKDIADLNLYHFMVAYNHWISEITERSIYMYAYYHDCLSSNVYRRTIDSQSVDLENQDTQESFVILRDLEEDDEDEIGIDGNEKDDIPDLVEDDVKNSDNIDNMIDFVGDLSDDIDDIREIIWSDYNYKLKKKSDGLNSLMDFILDDIRKLVDDKNKNFFRLTCFLLADIRNLFSDKVLLKKIGWLVKENKDNKNDYKIFILVLSLLQQNNDGLHCFRFFDIIENSVNKAALQKTLPKKMKFRLLGFFKKHLENVTSDNFFNEEYQKICKVLFGDDDVNLRIELRLLKFYKVLFGDDDVNLRIELRLLKFYKDRFPVKSKNSDMLINYLFYRENDLLEHKELINSLAIGKHDQITEFIKDGYLKSNFSSESIGRFITGNEDMFFDGKGETYTLNINMSQYSIKLIDTKSSRVMKFLLLILDISQDKNFCNPKQKLTIDYILELAKNIDDYKDRYKFKILALSYFLPDENTWLENNELHEINLLQYMADIKKLFADELSNENNRIDEKDKLEIKYMAIDVLIARRDLIRQDAIDLNFGDNSYFKTYRFYDSPDNFLKTGARSFLYYHTKKNQHSGELNMCVSGNSFSDDRNRLGVIDDILDFFDDDINKSIKNKNFFEDYGFLLTSINNLCESQDLLQKINGLIEQNQNNQNDYKIFVLIFALIQDFKSPDFCINESMANKARFINNPYGIYNHNDTLKYLMNDLPSETKFKLIFFHNIQRLTEEKINQYDDFKVYDQYFSGRDKLVDMLFTNFEQYIDQFCLYCKEAKFNNNICKNVFSGVAFRIFETNYLNVTLSDVDLCIKRMLDHVVKKILQGDKCTNLFLYDFLAYYFELLTYDIKKYRSFRGRYVACLECCFSLLAKDRSMNNSVRKVINNFIMEFFVPENLQYYLTNDKFVKFLASTIKDKRLNFTLDSPNKSFFSYIKECLKSMTNNSNDNPNIVTQHKKLLNDRALLKKQINNLEISINKYGNYWFNSVPVLGWICWRILYFVKISAMQNELNVSQQRLIEISNTITGMEELGCGDIETFIDSEDDYNKNEKNLDLKIGREKDGNISNDNISGNQPSLNKLGNVK